MPVIKLQDVSKLYGFGDATTVALDEVNLTINHGEFVAIMGPSGSGKTTLVNIIGLLDHPTHGKYVLDEVPAVRMRTSRRARLRRDQIGFIFQSFSLLPRLTVLENVALPLTYKGVGLSKRHKQASALLHEVGLREREYYYPRHLSGGQSQRVAIARALINNPKLIIADEPTGNLDSASSRVVMELLSEIHKTGTTILLVTHNPELTRYASRVLYMHDGSIVHDEINTIGQVAAKAKELLYTFPRTTEEDDLAGVSALMQYLPTKGGKPGRKAKKPSTKAKKVTPTRARKRGKKA